MGDIGKIDQKIISDSLGLIFQDSERVAINPSIRYGVMIAVGTADSG